jgi:calcium-dependent protein kinase
MNKLHSMTELVVRFLMRQILDAVAYLHNRKVLHGDIKMENLLLYTAVKKAQKRFTVLSLDTKNESLQKEINLSFQKRSLTFNTKKFMRNITSYEIKLIDFGCSKIFSKKHHKNLSGIIGTSAYCSPEVIDDIYDERCDEWSCGVLMYLLLCGEIPFPGDTEEEMFSKIKKGKFSFHQKEFKNVSNNAKDLICNLLMYNKDYRITASQALQHPFFTESFDPKLLSYNKDLTKLTELIEIKKFGKFQESIIAYLTINFIDKDEENQLKEVFRYIDKNNKNFLKKEDIEYCFKANGYFLDKESIDHIFSVLDYDMNGVVEYQEFFRALVDKKKLFSDENLKVAFELLDENKKNEISWNDIKRVFFHEQKMNDNLIDEYLKEIGMTKEKTLNFQEFCKVMRKCL